MPSSSSGSLSFSPPPLLFHILLWLLRTSRSYGFASWMLPTRECSSFPFMDVSHQEMFIFSTWKAKKRAFILCVISEMCSPTPPSVEEDTFQTSGAFSHPVLSAEFINKVCSLGNWALMCWFKCLGEVIIVVSEIPFLFSVVNFKFSLCFSDFFFKTILQIPLCCPLYLWGTFYQRKKSLSHLCLCMPSCSDSFKM